MANSYPKSPTTFLEFSRMFPDDAACVEWMAQWRWPDGFVCPACGHTKATRLRTRRLWQCCSPDCRHQTSVTAGTALHRSKQPLMVWLYALWLLAVRKVSISALQLQRETGIGQYRTAWNLLHKVRATLDESDDYPLSRGSIEVDESQVGGRGTGGGRQLGLGGRWVVIAVERIPVTKGEKSYVAAGAARACVAWSTDGATLNAFITAAIRKGSKVVTDGWSGYSRLTKKGFVHSAEVTHSDGEIVEVVQPKVHLLFSNFKVWLNGTFHGVSGSYLDKYLREYIYRFNRRNKGAGLFGFFVRRVVSAPWTSNAALRPCAEPSA